LFEKTNDIHALGSNSHAPRDEPFQWKLVLVSTKCAAK
jgi:hypothetical protein